MRVRSTATYNRRVLPRKVMTFAVSVALFCVGFLMCAPYLYVMFVLGYNFHYMTFWVVMMLIGLMVGGPMFVGGLIGILTSGELVYDSNSSMSDIDIARIRHAVEMDARRNIGK